MGSITTAIFLQRGGHFVSPALHKNSDLHNRTPLEQLMSWTHYLPIEHRKWLLNCTRIQSNPFSNYALSEEFSKLHTDPLVASTSKGIVMVEKEHLLGLVSNLVDSPIACSILSYMCRAETTIFRSEFREQVGIAMEKEIETALEFASNEQVLNYSMMFGGEDTPLCPEISISDQSRVNFLIVTGLRRMRHEYNNQDHQLLLPSYNGKKTVGYTTQENYYRNSSFLDVERNMEVTGLDL